MSVDPKPIRLDKNHVLIEEEMAWYKPGKHIVRLARTLAARGNSEAKDLRVLDWGCGRGRAVAWLRERGFDACGVDIDRKVLRNGHELFRGHETPKLLSDCHRRPRYSDGLTAWCRSVLTTSTYMPMLTKSTYWLVFARFPEMARGRSRDSSTLDLGRSDDRLQALTHPLCGSAMEPGTRLGHYEIVSPLGAGGMGEVYRTRDTTLDREVAIKVLPEDFASDPARLARFEREAKLLASLNHPNIATIHGFDASGGVRFIAMELVEGDSLAERIAATGRIEVDEALQIARRIALALEAAHEAGVIHRDLKPANVQVASDGKGTVKVLDFGLAKAHDMEGKPSSESSQSPTMMAATQAGVILGTAPYMSPEQARGVAVDRRSDIWAFGCVLYEMLTGTRAFDGDTVSDTMAAVLKEEPDWKSVAGVAPRAVLRLLRRCLAKDPRQRLHRIADARIELDEAIASPEESAESMVEGDLEGVVVGALGIEKASPAERVAWLAGGAVAGTALIFLALWIVGQGEPPTSSRQLTLSFPNVAGVSWPALSPSGDHVAFVGEERLWVRRLDELTARELDGTDRASNPFWSPDGR